MNKIAVIVLAGGQSTRFGVENKLLARLSGKTLIEHSLDALCAINSQIDSVFLVCQVDIATWLSKQPRYKRVVPLLAKQQQNMSASIVQGIGHIMQTQQYAACFISLADMPLVDSTVYTKILSQFEKNHKSIDIFAPYVASASVTNSNTGNNSINSNNKKLGHPVLFKNTVFSELVTLKGDTGAKTLLGQANFKLETIEVACQGIYQDIDTMSDLESIKNSN